MSLVETDWLEKNLNKVVILDCSWHMPNTNRNGLKEYESKHIPKAIFFDLDKNSKKDSNLPHMLVKISDWNKIVSRMGIKREDRVVIYDNSDVLSSCRCWFNFIYFGHDPKLVHVLNGGFEKWLNEKKKVTNIIENINLDYLKHILNKIKSDLLKIEKKYKKINKGFSITMNKERIYDSINISKNELIIKKIMAAAKKNNFKTLPVETGGGADANFFVKNGINTVNLGTGMREFHTKKEKLILKEFYKAGEIVFDTLVDI